jgi:hypothetical protein
LENSLDGAINQLAALQDLDRQLREKTELLQTLTAEIASLESQLAAQKEAARSAASERDAQETRRRQLETELEDEESKMTDRRMRLNRVRNEKELQALRREIEVAKEANQQREEEILRVFELLDGLNANASEAVRLQLELEVLAATQLEQRRERIRQLGGEIDAARGGREQMTQSLDGSVLRKYEQIFARRGGTAVVEVRNGICLGCHMNVPPQFYNELQRATDIRSCPNCHRILFWRAERVESAQSAR